MATTIAVEGPDGKTTIFHQYEGFTIPDHFVQKALPAKDLVVQLDWIKSSEVRHDDVVICAYPKTGTHWTWEIVSMIQRATPEYIRDIKVSAMLEFNTQEMTSSLTSPRVLNTHFTHNLLPAGIKEKRCKIVHVLRNPKDVCVSMYFHFKNEFQDKMAPMDWFMKSFRGAVGAHFICSYLWYVRHWERFCDENPDYPVINVFYEDLKKNPGPEIARLAKFLGKDLDDATITAIGDKCQFSNLKQANDELKNDRVAQRSKDGKSFIYRKDGHVTFVIAVINPIKGDHCEEFDYTISGEVGDWKNYMTVAESEAFDEWIEKEMKVSKMKFQYE